MIKSKVAKIFKDHWNGFIETYGHKIRKNVLKEVEKMLRCRDLNYGYIEFKCPTCDEVKKVGFTCKSRFCTSCGKVYVDKWIESMLTKLINVKHRHIVFTIPEELREVFARERELLKLLPQCAAKTLVSWCNDQNKKEQYTPGVVTVIHTFGRDLKWNPHVHVMVTEGMSGNKNEWKHIRHFPYEMLRKRWQKLLLYALMEKSKEKKKMRCLKDKLYKKHDSGFYVHAKTEIKSAREAAKYVGRYVGRPVIAESRILAYDGVNVTFEYVRHEDNEKIIETVHAYDFIKKLIIHIPEKNFKMVRYFGIYARRSNKTKDFIKMFEDKICKLRRSLNRWEYRIMAAFGVDPKKCHKCGTKMIFNDIYYRSYGSMRELLKKKILYENTAKLEEAIEIYGVMKGIIYGKMKSI